jgi:hypothetical protein
MTMTEIVRGHQARSVPHLARLRMLADGQAETPLPPGVLREVTAAVAAVMAEAQAAGSAVATASVSGAGNQPLLAARMHRLGRAAREAVASARDGNPAVLRNRVRRFEAMTSAMWTVHLSMCEHDRFSRRSGPLKPRSGDGWI